MQPPPRPAGGNPALAPPGLQSVQTCAALALTLHYCRVTCEPCALPLLVCETAQPRSLYQVDRLTAPLFALQSLKPARLAQLVVRRYRRSAAFARSPDMTLCSPASRLPARRRRP